LGIGGQVKNLIRAKMSNSAQDLPPSPCRIAGWRRYRYGQRVQAEAYRDYQSHDMHSM
jgi:hypothetical protein